MARKRPLFGPSNYKKRLEENDQEEIQKDQIKIQKIIRGKNIEDKEDNYGYNKSNITNRCG